jgi:hypothetical protein
MLPCPVFFEKIFLEKQDNTAATTSFASLPEKGA